MITRPISIQQVNLSNDLYKEIATNICVNDAAPALTAIAMLYNRVENLKVRCEMNEIYTEDSINHDKSVYSFQLFKRQFPDTISGAFSLPTHEKFIEDNIKQKVRIWVFPEDNSVVFFGSIDTQAWHCLISFIPKYFNVFKEKPLTNEEKNFLKTLVTSGSSGFVPAYNELLMTEEFQRFVAKRSISTFEKKLFNAKLESEKAKLKSIEDRIDGLMKEYREECDRRVNAMIMVTGLETMEAQQEDCSELQSYILNNKHLCNVSVDGTNINFIVKTELVPHHMAEWQSISDRGTLFSRLKAGSMNDVNDIKLLMDAIFSEKRTLKLKMCAYFKMDYFGNRVDSAINYDYVRQNPSLKDYMPNPHFNRHNCMLENRTDILNQLRMGDAVGAIECAISCTQRVNIHEGMTFEPFIREMFSKDGKFLVAKDGTELTVKEAVEMLKGKTNA